MKINISDRLKKLPPYLFLEIDQAKRKARAQGRDIIDFGVGDPDIPTPKHIINKLYEAAKEPANHRYALDQGMPELRRAIADWYNRRFNVALNPDTEILPLIGSKEGIAHIPIAFLNKGDVVLAPEPGYPPYRTATILAEGEPHLVPLLEVNNFLPDLKKIPNSALKKARLMFANYPNNPTAACAPDSFYKELINFANKNNIIICSDAAYSEMAYEGYKPRSFLEFEGAKEVGVEFHSFSKTYNMTGWRIGWVCGNTEVIAALGKVKSNIDSGIFQAIQVAGVTALETDQSLIDEIVKTYQQRRDCLVDGLNEIGWKVNSPKATFYVWLKLPSRDTLQRVSTSSEFAKLVLEKCDCIITPGNGFGPSGEGYVRFALTVPRNRIQEALERFKRI